MKTILGLTVLVASVAAVPRLVPAQEPTPGRPLVIFVHGRAQQHKLRDDMLRSFRDALRDGLRRIGDGSLADELQDDDVRMVHYYDLSMPTEPRIEASTSFCSAPPKRTTNTGSLATPFGFAERDGKERKAVLNLVERLPFVPDFSLLALEDTRDYLKHAGTRCATNQRLIEQLEMAKGEGRPVIVVAHSMGSLVAFDVLATQATPTASLPPGAERPVGTVPTVDRLVLIGSQLPAKGLRKNLSSGVDPRMLRLNRVRDVVLVKGRFDWVGMRTHDGTPFVETNVPYHDIEIDTDPNDPHAVSSYLQHPLVALAIAAPFCRILKSRCELESLVVSACDYDVFARELLEKWYPKDPSRQLLELEKWSTRGRKETPWRWRSSILKSSRKLPSFSGREEHLSEDDVRRCTEKRSDVRTSFTRNPQDSIRALSMHLSAYGVTYRGNGTKSAASLELGVPMLDMLPIPRPELAKNLVRDIRVGYELVDGQNGAVFARAYLAFGIYGRLRLTRLREDSAREAVGMSFGQYLSKFQALRGIFSHHLNQPGNDLFIEYAPANKLLTMSRVAFGARYVTF